MVLASAALSRSSIEVGDIGKHRQALRRHFGKPAEHDDLLLLAAGKHRHDAGTNACHHRRVAGQHAEITLGAGNVDLIDLTGKHELLGRDEIELEGGHVCLLPDLLILRERERDVSKDEARCRLALRDAGLPAGSSG